MIYCQFFLLPSTRSLSFFFLSNPPSFLIRLQNILCYIVHFVWILPSIRSFSFFSLTRHLSSFFFKLSWYIVYFFILFQIGSLSSFSLLCHLFLFFFKLSYDTLSILFLFCIQLDRLFFFITVTFILPHIVLWYFILFPIFYLQLTPDSFLTCNLYLSTNCLVIHRPFFIQASTSLFHRFVFPAIIILYFEEQTVSLIFLTLLLPIFLLFVRNIWIFVICILLFYALSLFFSLLFFKVGIFLNFPFAFISALFRFEFFSALIIYILQLSIFFLCHFCSQETFSGTSFLIFMKKCFDSIIFRLNVSTDEYKYLLR